MAFVFIVEFPVAEAENQLEMIYRQTDIALQLK